MNYTQFMGGVMSKGAINDGQTVCSVKLNWQDVDGHPIEIKRVWFFTSEGKHRASEDTLHIYEGKDRRPLEPPVTEVNHELWYRNWIYQKFLHHNLADFFLFDGEDMRSYLVLEPKNQVRSAIKGLLGLPVLEGLKESLKKYARDQASSVDNPPSEKQVTDLNNEIDDLENDIETNKELLDEKKTEFEQVKKRIEYLIHTQPDRGTVADIGELIIKRDKHYQNSETARNELFALLSGDTALAISGKKLRNDTISQLEAEAKLESWEQGSKESNENLRIFSLDLSNRLSQLTPSLDSDQISAIVVEATEAWKKLWHTAPEGCADQYMHKGLDVRARSSTIDKLISIDGRNASEGNMLVKRWEKEKNAAETIKQTIINIETIGDEKESNKEELEELILLRDKIKERMGELENIITYATSTKNAKELDLSKLLERQGRDDYQYRYAQFAKKYAKLIDELLKSAIPLHTGSISIEMTKVWKGMAQLSDRVEKIEISRDCDVRMLDENGKEVKLVKSAGANQVFVMALITAVTIVSGKIFPFIVDTPLGRLSLEHRLNVLKTFTDRPESQVILLSTDQEVVDDKLEAIRERIAACYRLDASNDKHGLLTTTVIPLSLSEI